MTEDDLNELKGLISDRIPPKKPPQTTKEKREFRDKMRWRWSNSKHLKSIQGDFLRDVNQIRNGSAIYSHYQPIFERYRQTLSTDDFTFLAEQCNVSHLVKVK